MEHEVTQANLQWKFLFLKFPLSDTI